MSPSPTSGVGRLVVRLSLQPEPARQLVRPFEATLYVRVPQKLFRLHVSVPFGPDINAAFSALFATTLCHLLDLIPRSRSWTLPIASANANCSVGLALWGFVGRIACSRQADVTPVRRIRHRIGVRLPCGTASGAASQRSKREPFSFAGAVRADAPRRASIRHRKRCCRRWSTPPAAVPGPPATASAPGAPPPPNRAPAPSSPPAPDPAVPSSSPARARSGARTRSCCRAAR